MDLTELIRWRPRVEKALDARLAMAVREARGLNPLLAPSLSGVRDFNLRGGKRFRALLLLAGYHLARGRDPAKVLSAAAALETFQGWMLAHDDVIDHGETRRGGPSLHVAMAGLHSGRGWLGSSAEFGEAAAITLGDLLEPLTVEGFLEVPVSPSRVTAALGEYHRMARMTALGELLDVILSVQPVARVSPKDVLTVHRLKSAIYTVSAPLRMGAILAGGRPALLELLSSVGDDLGVAFQLRDDVLGLGISSEHVVGKSTNDLMEGKRTLLVVDAWREGGRDQRMALEAVLGNPLASPEQFDQAITVLQETGSLDRSEEMIGWLKRRAYRKLDASTALDASRRQLLHEIGEMLTDRKV